MSKKQFAVVCALLILVIVLLALLILKTNTLYDAQINGMNYLSEKLDALTSYVKTAE